MPYSISMWLDNIIWVLTCISMLRCVAIKSGSMGSRRGWRRPIHLVMRGWHPLTPLTISSQLDQQSTIWKYLEWVQKIFGAEKNIWVSRLTSRLSWGREGCYSSCHFTKVSPTCLSPQSTCRQQICRLNYQVREFGKRNPHYKYLVSPQKCETTSTMTLVARGQHSWQ